ncbi:MAG: hypothetical protein U9N50_01710 [Pseudomonadota bacterium]|nr:hypothetical protein [Pseudomonadota bacterium]
MNPVIFFLLSYFAAGVVFITREADQQTVGDQNITPCNQHIFRRISAGMVIMLLWPAFLIEQTFKPGRPPMAVRTEHFNQ